MQQKGIVKAKAKSGLDAGHGPWHTDILCFLNVSDRFVKIDGLNVSKC